VRETFPKERVSSTGFGQKSFISQTSFRQRGNVDVVSADLSGNEALFILFWTTRILIGLHDIRQ